MWGLGETPLGTRPQFLIAPPTESVEKAKTNHFCSTTQGKYHPLKPSPWMLFSTNFNIPSGFLYINVFNFRREPHPSMSLSQTNQWLKLTRISSDCSTTTTNLTHLYQQKQTWMNLMACTFTWSHESKDNILITWTTSIGSSLIYQSSPVLPFLAQGIGWGKEMTEEKAREEVTVWKQQFSKCLFFHISCLEVWIVWRFSVNYTYFILHKCCLENDQQSKFSYPHKPGWGTELPLHWVWGSHMNGHKQCSPLIYSYPSNRTSEIPLHVLLKTSCYKINFNFITVQPKFNKNKSWQDHSCVDRNSQAILVILFQPHQIYPVHTFIDFVVKNFFLFGSWLLGMKKTSCNLPLVVISTFDWPGRYSFYSCY